MTSPISLKDAISKFGSQARAKLGNPAAIGQPEDQLRGPLETLFHDIGQLIGLAATDAVLVGEISLTDIMTRPNYAVTRKGALIGFIEVKAPGKGVDPTKFPAKSHDRAQWERLKSLPNLIYTDGNGFSLWRNGKLATTITVVLGNPPHREKPRAWAGDWVSYPSLQDLFAYIAAGAANPAYVEIFRRHLVQPRVCSL